jgi:hypothetical protein
MKRKLSINRINILAFTIMCVFAFVSEKVSAQATYTYTIRNDMQTSDRTMEFDLYLLNTNAAVPIEISLAQAGIIINPDLKNGGTITASFVAGASQMVAAQVPTAITFASATNCIKIAAKSIPSCGSGTVLSTTAPGTRLCRVKLTNTVAWGQVKPNLAFNFTATPYNTFIGKFREDCTGSDQMPIDGSIGFSEAYNHIQNAPVTPVTITGVTADSKIYDGKTNAVIKQTGSVSGVLGTDEVSVDYSSAIGTFDSKNVGTGIGVTLSGFGLTGRDAQYYSLSAQPAKTSANITKKEVTIEGVTASNKIYDDTKTATITTGNLVGVVTTPADVVTIKKGTGLFASKNIGVGIGVTATGFDIEGADVANYQLKEQPAVTSADITKATVTINNVTASDKVYDRFKTASLSLGTLDGIKTGDDGIDVVTIVKGTGEFNVFTAGTSIPIVNVTGYDITGADAGNYQLSGQPVVPNAAITKKPVTIDGLLVTTKYYDGLNAATITGGTVTGVIAPDVVTIKAGTGVFTSVNVAKSIPVTATSFDIEGADAANYSLSKQPDYLTGEIKPYPLTVKVLFEGVWNNSNSNMNQFKTDDGVTPKFSGTVVDTVSIELHNSTNYATVVHRASNLELHQDGTITTAGKDYIIVPDAMTGTYYVTVKSRNHLETTSATAISFASEPKYDFTTAANKAFGDNQATYNSKYVLYSGDITGSGGKQDGQIDGLDAMEIDNDINAFATGYLKTDINGDGVVDGLDAILVNNNVSNFISTMLP